MSLFGLLLVVILICLIVGAAPNWPYSAGWGPYPSGTLGMVLLIVILLVVVGRL